MLYALIFISTMFMTSSLHSMEIVKKHKNHPKPNPTLKKYLLIQEISKSKGIPNEISSYIIQYHIELRNNHLLDKCPAMVAWDNVHIPINYYDLLTSTQIGLINEMLLNRHGIIKPCRHRTYHSLQKDYFLQSKKDYQLFLTVPIEVRKCLAQAPKSLINDALNPQFYYRGFENSIPKTVNEFQVIQVKSESTVIKHKLQKKLNRTIDADFVGYEPWSIVPEEKELSHK